MESYYKCRNCREIYPIKEAKCPFCGNPSFNADMVHEAEAKCLMIKEWFLDEIWESAKVWLLIALAFLFSAFFVTAEYGSGAEAFVARYAEGRTVTNATIASVTITENEYEYELLLDSGNEYYYKSTLKMKVGKEMLVAIDNETGEIYLQTIEMLGYSEKILVISCVLIILAVICVKRASNCLW